MINDILNFKLLFTWVAFFFHEVFNLFIFYSTLKYVDVNRILSCDIALSIVIKWCIKMTILKFIN